MIIECPACKTRYDIKAALPPEGRTVRCAKCNHKWHATPIDVGDAVEADAGAPVAEQEQAASALAAKSIAEEMMPSSEAFAPRLPPKASREGAVHDTMEAPSYHDGIFEGSARDPSDRIINSPQENAYPETATSPPPEMQTEKVRWFGSFRRRNESQDKPDSSDGAQATLVTAGAAATIPFPRTPFSEAPDAAAEELQTLEEARAAVRSVFSSLSESRQVAAHSYVLPVIPTSEPSHLAEGRERFDRAEDEEEQSAEVLARHRVADLSEFASQKQGHVFHNSDMEEEEPEAEDNGDWSGFTQREAAISDGNRNWNSAATFDRSAQDFEEESAEPEGESDARLRETLDRNVALWKRPSLPLDEIADRAIEDANLADDVAEESKEIAFEDEGTFDNRLYRELEEKHDHAQEIDSLKTRGGLALAAAWGLFICAAAGLIVGFFSFRDIVADALPGLAPLYRSLGMPVTVQPLVFEDVQYDWTLSDQKPALVIRGAVYNRAQRKVKVPAFFVTIKDRDSQLDREYSVNLQTTSPKIKAGQRAEFEIELLSPNPTITALELELRSVR